MSTAAGRRRHYGSFYRLDGATADAPVVPGAKNVLVHGNCQAEAIRVLLAASDGSPVNTIRVPPVFELEPSDIPFLQAAAANAQVLIGQPVRDDYRDLPLGTRQVADMMPPGATVLVVPVIRFAGLHPYQAIVRDPRDRSRNPPVVPYHDLRTLAQALLGLDNSRTQDTPSSDLAPSSDTAPVEENVASEEMVLAVGEASQRELRRREDRDCDIRISDVFMHPQAGDMSTINHPGNRILLELVGRLQTAMGLAPDAVEPGRTLLGEVVAPVERPVAAAWHLPAPASDEWIVHGRPVAPGVIQDAQMRWYAANPEVVRAGLDRHRSTMDLLGLL